MFSNEFVKITSKVWRPGEGARGKIEMHLEHPWFKLSNFLIFSQRRQCVQVSHKSSCFKKRPWTVPGHSQLAWPGLDSEPRYWPIRGQLRREPANRSSCRAWLRLRQRESVGDVTPVTEWRGQRQSRDSSVRDFQTRVKYANNTNSHEYHICCDDVIRLASMWELVFVIIM